MCDIIQSFWLRVSNKAFTSYISGCRWPIIGLDPAAKTRGGTFEGPGPNRYRSGTSRGRSMPAGGGMVTEDMERSRRCSRGALLAASGLSRAAVACWASSALRLNKARCITAGVLVPEKPAPCQIRDRQRDWTWLWVLGEDLKQKGLWPVGQGAVCLPLLPTRPLTSGNKRGNIKLL